jgi:Lrp/AsnC family transcriptional regulator, leucine-responsive regulatory protein
MLDKKSLKILKILQEKARIPNTEVSRQVGLAPSAVLERIRKMETQGIIDGYEVRLNPERFFRNQVAFVNVECDNTADADGEIGKTLAEIDEIQEVHYIAGEDCYLIKLRVSDTRELGNFLRREIFPIPGIRSIRSSVVLETYKETARISIR